MSADDLQLNIPLDVFNDFISCTVCLSTMHKSHITKCGHRFCEKCIKEWVNRRHTCPCCNHQLDDSQLIADLQFDALIEKLQEEKVKSEKKYFDELINATTSAAQHDGDNVSLNNHFSPVELVLKKHLKTSLAAHEKYYRDLKEEVQQRKRQIQLELDRNIELLAFQQKSQQELDDEKQRLKNDSEEQIQKLHADLTSCGQMVADAYDRYLSDQVPPLQVLPVSVKLCVLSKKYTIQAVTLKPQDSLADIIEMVKNHYSTANDSVVKMAADLSFILFGPLANLTCDEMSTQVTPILHEHVTQPHVTLLPPGCRPVLQFSIKPGSTIAIYGQIECESDQPKQCIVTTFIPDQPLPIDYFTCKTCGFNWICRSCMSVCHKDHEVVPYILNHKPNWPCCYCVKKKKCVLIR